MPGCARIGSKFNNGAVILGPGVPAVTVNGIPVSVVGDKVSDKHTVSTGSQSVSAGGKAVVRKGDLDSGGHKVDSLVSNNVIINGP